MKIGSYVKRNGRCLRVSTKLKISKIETLFQNHQRGDSDKMLTRGN